MAIFEGMSRAELESHRAFHQQQIAEITSGKRADEWGTTRMMSESVLESVEEELAKLDQQPAVPQPEEPDAMMTLAAFTSILSERAAQQAKWGTQRHDFPVWQTVLSEEVGELAEAILRYRQAGFDPSLQALLPTLLREMRGEAVQIAAVAVAIVEHLDELIEEPRS